MGGATARRHVAEALRGYEALGDERFRGRCLGYLGLAALLEGDGLRAQALLARSLSAFDVLGEPSGTAEALTGLSCVAAVQGEPLRAATLAGAAERLRESFAGRALPVERRFTEERLRRVRDAATQAAWEQAWTAGRALRLEDAIVLAQEPQGASTVSAPGTTSTVSGSEPTRSPSA